MGKKSYKIRKVSCVKKEKKFYEEQWFWMAITIIVVSLTRSVKVIGCGNGNGSGSGNYASKSGKE